MGLLSVLRNGISIANTLTADLQDEVIHEAWIGTNFDGSSRYADPVPRPSIVEKKTRMVRGIDGKEISSSHYVGFLYPITPNGAEDRQEPVDPRDRITLSNGSTAPIVSLDGFMDRENDRPLYTQVFLG